MSAEIHNFMQRNKNDKNLTYQSSPTMSDKYIKMQYFTQIANFQIMLFNQQLKINILCISLIFKAWIKKLFIGNNSVSQEMWKKNKVAHK